MRQRLVKRGITLSAGLLAGALAGATATAAVPATLAQTTMRAALLLGAGQAAAKHNAEQSVKGAGEALEKSKAVLKELQDKIAAETVEG